MSDDRDIRHYPTFFRNCARVEVVKQKIDVADPSKKRHDKSIGTAFFIETPKGITTVDTNTHYLLTCSHVVESTVLGKVVIVLDGDPSTHIPAHVVCICPDFDIACLRVRLTDTQRNNITALPFCKDPFALNIGTTLYACGYGLGLSCAVTKGTLNQFEKGKLRISCPIQPGNSGGPCYAVLNGRICIVGINSSGILSAQNVGFAIPITHWTMVERQGTNHINEKPTTTAVYRQSMLGFCYHPSSTVDRPCGERCQGGVRVHFIFKKSALQNAGLRQDDVVFEIKRSSSDQWRTINQKGFLRETKDKATELRVWLSDSPPQTTFDLKFYRPSDKSVKEVSNVEKTDCVTGAFRETFHPWEPMNSVNFAGMVVQPLRSHLKSKLNHLFSRSPSWLEQPHLVVTYVIPGSIASPPGLGIVGPGLILDNVNGQPVRTLKDYRRALVAKNSEETIEINFDHGRQVKFAVSDVVRDAKEHVELGIKVDGPILRALLSGKEDPPRDTITNKDIVPTPPRSNSQFSKDRKRPVVVQVSEGSDGGCALM